MNRDDGGLWLNATVPSPVGWHLRAGTVLGFIQRQPAGTFLGEAERQAWDDSHNIEPV